MSDHSDSELDSLDPELRRFGQSLLASARVELEPTEADRIRVERAVSMTIAGLGAARVSPSDSPPSIERAPFDNALRPAQGLAAAKGAAAAKALTAVFIAASLGGIGYGLVRGFGGESAHRDEAEEPRVVAPVMPTEADGMGDGHHDALAATTPTEAVADDSQELARGLSVVPMRVAGAQGPAVQRGQREQTPESSTLADEAGIIARANEALASGNARRALDLTNQHASRFPAGALREERVAARILALCGVGRTHEAEAERRLFAARYPSSIHRARLRASCAGWPE